MTELTEEKFSEEVKNKLLEEFMKGFESVMESKYLDIKEKERIKNLMSDFISSTSVHIQNQLDKLESHPMWVYFRRRSDLFQYGPYPAAVKAGESIANGMLQNAQKENRSTILFGDFLKALIESSKAGRTFPIC